MSLLLFFNPVPINSTHDTPLLGISFNIKHHSPSDLLPLDRYIQNHKMLKSVLFIITKHSIKNVSKATLGTLPRDELECVQAFSSAQMPS